MFVSHGKMLGKLHESIGVALGPKRFQKPRVVRTTNMSFQWLFTRFARRKMKDYRLDAAIAVYDLTDLMREPPRGTPTGGVAVTEALNSYIGDPLLDEDDLFVSRDESKVHFRRNERTVLLILTRNPNRRMTRSRLLILE